MNRRFPWPHCGLFLTAGLLLAGLPAVAQRAAELEPRWLRMQIPEVSAGLEVESLHEERRVSDSSVTQDQLSIVPLIGVRTKGSIYHPNLLSFDANAEGGWDWLTDRVESSDSTRTRDESGDLLRYLAHINVLPSKPYTANFSAAQDHTFRNYDSFSTYTVDTTRYAGSASWDVGTLSLNADVGYRDEEATGISSSTEVVETFGKFQGFQKRETGSSSLNYRYTDYHTSVASDTSQTSHNSVSHAVGVGDTERFGSRRQITATTGATYSQYNYSGKPTETITGSEHITFKHRPKLQSYVSLNYNETSQTETDYSFFQGMSGVRHQLYESLTSHLEVHGNYDESSSSSFSGYNDRYGVGLHEDYSKKVGSWGRLSMNGAIIVDHEDHESTGTMITVFDEAHILYLTTSSSYRPAYLNNPRVFVSTIEVRGPGGIPAQEGVDYEIIQTGQLTEIRLVMGSVILHDGDQVLVNYQSESLYTAAFESFNGNVQIRLDLFRRFGIYGRLNWMDNNAPPEAITQTLTDLVFGADVNWRWFRAGAEYEDYDSNFSRYEAWRFFQSFNYQTARGSTLNVDFTQSFYEYEDSGSQERYQFVTRYHTQLPFSLAWFAEGGYSLQQVLGTEQDFAFARTGLTWSRGKLSVRTGYDFNYQTTANGQSTEERNRHHLFLYVKRTF